MLNKFPNSNSEIFMFASNDLLCALRSVRKQLLIDVLRTETVIKKNIKPINKHVHYHHDQREHLSAYWNNGPPPQAHEPRHGDQRSDASVQNEIRHVCSISAFVPKEQPGNGCEAQDRAFIVRNFECDERTQINTTS